MKSYGWVISSIGLVSVAQLLMKWGMAELAPLLEYSRGMGFASVPLGALLAVGSGILAYVASMGCWLCVLRYLPLSTAYPLLSLSYALVYLAAVGLPCFTESVSGIQLLGVVLIIIGVCCIARVENQATPPA